MTLFWNAKTSHEAATSCVEQAHRDSALSSPRREAALTYGSLYEGVELTSFGSCAYAMQYERGNCVFRGTSDPIIRNTAHALVDTFVSKIAAVDTPLPAFLTTEGSWRDRRQAKDLERLVEAEYRSPMGGCATLHELWIEAFRLAAAATGGVLLRFWNDCGRVNAKIHDSLDCSISKDGRWVVLRTWYEVDDAIELFPDREADIRAAAQDPPIDQKAPQLLGYNAPQMVCIYEGWHGAKGGKDGTYVAALNHAGVDALKWDDYPHERPPVVKMVIVPHLRGVWGHSLTHHAFESIYRDNLMLGSIDQSIENTNKQINFIDKNQLVDDSALDGVEDNVNVYTQGDPRLAVYTVESAGFHAQHLNVANLHRDDAGKVVGVSEMHSEGKHEQGVDSAEGQRFIAALINERFAAVQRRYVQAVAVDSAKVIIQILCDIYQDDRKLTRHWPGQDTLREVSGAVALHGIEKLKYVIQPAAVSGDHGSPADRQQTAFELYKSGVLSQNDYSELQSRGYDLPAKLQERDIQSEWLERQIDRWQYASDKDAAKPDFYLPPMRGVDVPTLILKTIDGFMKAQLEQLESSRQEFYLMMLADLSTLLAANQSQPNQNPTLAPAPPQQAVAA